MSAQYPTGPPPRPDDPYAAPGGVSLGTPSWYRPPAPVPAPPMTVGRFVLLASIPVDILLFLWMWFGRAFFDAAGWYVLLFPMVAGPVLAVLLAPGWWLSFRRLGTRGALPFPHLVTKLVSWAAMVLFGYTLVDFGDDGPRGRSILTQVFGPQYESLSNSLATVAAVVVVATLIGYIVLLARLPGVTVAPYVNYAPVNTSPTGPWGPIPGAATHEPWGAAQAPIPPGQPPADPWAPPR